MEGSQFEPQCRQNMNGVLEVSARTPSEHCPGTLEQVTKPTNALKGPCDELGSYPGVDLPSPVVHPIRDSERDKVVK